MPLIKALIWVAVLIILVIFAGNNWVPVTIALWGDLLLDTKLPVLIIAAFLLGWLPLYLVYKAGSWRMQRQIRQLQSIPTDVPRNYVPDPQAPRRTAPAVPASTGETHSEDAAADAPAVARPA